jgi:hypothetical protein
MLGVAAGYQPSPSFLQDLLLGLEGMWGGLEEGLSPLLFSLAQWQVALSGQQQEAAVAAVKAALHTLDGPGVCSTCWALARWG